MPERSLYAEVAGMARGMARRATRRSYHVPTYCFSRVFSRALLGDVGNALGAQHGSRQRLEIVKTCFVGIDLVRPKMRIFGCVPTSRFARA
eukprot:6199160-Pleurochrysis_carterae.AAC.2